MRKNGKFTSSNMLPLISPVCEDVTSLSLAEDES